MLFQRRTEYLISALLCCALLLCCRHVACAAEPEDSLEKGIVPACSTELDRESCADGSLYENAPVDVEIVKIGLRYGEDADNYAEFHSESGQGFLIGYYDDERVFHEQTRTQGSWMEAARYGERIILLTWDYYEEFDAARGVAVFPVGGGPIWLDGCGYRGGFRLTACGDYALTVTNYVGLEDYVKGVVPYEMSGAWALEALRAQAVCARTYVVYNQNKYEEYDFDLTADTESQVYRGVGRATELSDQAVDSTAGLYVRYRGEICEVYYFASDGGATEDGKNVFGTERPYLAGKTDPFENAVDYTGRDWVQYRDAWDLRRGLLDNGQEIGPIAELQVEYSELGNVIAVRYTDESGSVLDLYGRDSYAFVGLGNSRFRADREDGLFVFRGNGWGHNCGMSQWGALAMAENYGYTCEDIIRFYFTGAYVG